MNVFTKVVKAFILVYRQNRHILLYVSIFLCQNVLSFFVFDCLKMHETVKEMDCAGNQEAEEDPELTWLQKAQQLRVRFLNFFDLIIRILAVKCYTA